MFTRLIAVIRREESGQALIELAISFPLLLLILLGAAELARASFEAIEVTNAARAAAQYGAMMGGRYQTTTNGGTNGLDSAGMLRAAQADAGNLSSSIAFASGYPTMSCSCTGAGTATCTATAPPSGCSPPTSQVLVTVTARVTASFAPLEAIPGLSHQTFNLYGWAQQEVMPQ